MVTNPKVTVLMSVYNCKKYLREAIDSILGQTFEDFEFLIIDDGSTDSSAKIIRSYADPRIRLIQNEENIGLTRSLNKGLKLAKGEYIARMDADDISLPSRFEKQVKALDENEKLGLLGTRYVKIDNKGNEKGEIPVPLRRENILKHFLLFGSAFCHSSMMFRKSYAKEIGFYDESMKFAQDYDFGLRLFEIYDIDNYPEVLQKWRYNLKTGISVKRVDEQKRYSTARRKRFIESRIKKGLINCQDFAELAMANPRNKLIVSCFFESYGKSEKDRENYYLTYLQLKYLHGDPKWRFLNEIAQVYCNQDKKSLAFMCLAESLRLNPGQTEILAFAEQLKEYAEPEYPQKLREDECMVTVVMRTYNRTEKIKESIQSVLNQTFQDFELIIINDGGADEVRKVIDSFKSNKIKYYRLDKNCGQAAALNEGILKANGKYIAYLDDDDIYYPKHLEILVSFLERNPNYDFVYSNSWWCYGKLENSKFVEKSRKLYEVRPQKFDKNLLFEKNYISILNVLHKKSCFRKTGLFNKELPHLVDWDMWKRYARHFKLHQLNEITGEYRWTKNNMTVTNRLKSIFFSHITKTYHQCNYGDICLLKSYFKAKQSKKAERILSQVIGDYNSSLKPRGYVEELFFLHPYLRNDNDKQFIQKVTKDFFKYHPRRCLREIVHVKSTLMLFSIIPLLPLRIIKILKVRTMRYIKQKATGNYNVF
jgi:glycosyltransferase involved in cell wall biosynthesis